MKFLLGCTLLALACGSTPLKKSKILAKPGDIIDTHASTEAKEKLNQLREIFTEGDIDGDGFHTLTEIQDVLMGNAKASLVEGFTKADKNHDGTVSEHEYLEFFDGTKEKREFRDTDANGDGKHTLDEQLNHFASTEPFLREMQRALETAKQILKHDDKDHDGRLSEKEFIEHSKTLLKPLQDEAAFKHADANHDGFHSTDEITAEIMRLAGFERREDGQFIEHGVEDAFTAADLNKDSEVTLEEYLKAYTNATKEDFALTDANADGKTTLDEVIKHQSARLVDTLRLARDEAKKYVAEADRDGDGRLDLAEKNNAVERRRSREMFAQGDTNGDGFHDAQEIKHEIIRQAGYTILKRTLDGRGTFHYFVPTSLVDGFRHADTNADEEVTEEEFMKAYASRDRSKQQTVQNFKSGDHDGDGRHTLDEMAKQIFASEEFKKLHEEAEHSSKKLLQQADKDGDGRVSDAEFLAHLLLIKDGNSSKREL